MSEEFNSRLKADPELLSIDAIDMMIRGEVRFTHAIGKRFDNIIRKCTYESMGLSQALCHGIHKDNSTISDIGKFKMQVRPDVHIRQVAVLAAVCSRVGSVDITSIPQKEA
jgi:hypothetical protein